MKMIDSKTQRREKATNPTIPSYSPNFIFSLSQALPAQRHWSKGSLGWNQPKDRTFILVAVTNMIMIVVMWIIIKWVVFVRVMRSRRSERCMLGARLNAADGRAKMDDWVAFIIESVYCSYEDIRVRSLVKRTSLIQGPLPTTLTLARTKNRKTVLWCWQFASTQKKQFWLLMYFTWHPTLRACRFDLCLHCNVRGRSMWIRVSKRIIRRATKTLAYRR